jgi:hypothetical protein
MISDPDPAPWTCRAPRPIRILVQWWLSAGWRCAPAPLFCLPANSVGISGICRGMSGGGSYDGLIGLKINTPPRRSGLLILSIGTWGRGGNRRGGQGASHDALQNRHRGGRSPLSWWYSRLLVAAALVRAKGELEIRCGRSPTSAAEYAPAPSSPGAFAAAGPPPTQPAAASLLTKKGGCKKAAAVRSSRLFLIIRPCVPDRSRRRSPASPRARYRD